MNKNANNIKYKKNQKDQSEEPLSADIFATQVHLENQLKNNELNQISETFREFLENKRSVSQMMSQIQIKSALGGAATSTRKMKHLSNQPSQQGSPLFKSKQILVAKSNTSVKMKLEQLSRDTNSQMNNSNTRSNSISNGLGYIKNNSSFTQAKENSFLASHTRSKTPSEVQSKFNKGQPNISLYNLIKNHQSKQNDMRFKRLKEGSDFGLGNFLADNNVENQSVFKNYMTELKVALKVENHIRQKREEEQGQTRDGSEQIHNQRDLYSISTDIYNFYKEFDIRTERVLFFNKSILNDMMNQNMSEKNNVLNIHQIESNLERLKKNFISIAQNGLLEINQKLAISFADILRCYNLIIDKLCSDIMTIQEQQKENIHVKHVKQLEEEIIRLRVKLNEQKRSTEILQQDMNTKQQYFTGKLKDQSLINQSLIQELNDSQTLLQNSLGEDKINNNINVVVKEQSVSSNHSRNQSQSTQKPQFGFLNLEIPDKNNNFDTDINLKPTQKQLQQQQNALNEDDEVRTRKTSSSSFSQQQIQTQDRNVLTTQFLMHLKPARKPSFIRQDSTNIIAKLNYKMMSQLKFWKGVNTLQQLSGVSKLDSLELRDIEKYIQSIISKRYSKLNKQIFNNFTPQFIQSVFVSLSQNTEVVGIQKKYYKAFDLIQKMRIYFSREQVNLRSMNLNTQLFHLFCHITPNDKALQNLQQISLMKNTTFYSKFFTHDTKSLELLTKIWFKLHKKIEKYTEENVTSLYSDYISIQTIHIWMDKLIKRKNASTNLLVFINLLNLCEVRKINNFLDEDQKFELILYYYLSYREYKRQSVIELALADFIKNSDHYKNDEIFKRRKEENEKLNQTNQSNNYGNLMQTCSKQLIDKMQQNVDFDSLISMVTSEYLNKEYFVLNKNSISTYFNKITENHEMRINIQNVIQKLTYYSSSINQYKIHKYDAVSLITYYIMYDLDDAYNFLLEDYKESGREYEITGKMKDNKYFSEVNEVEMDLAIYMNQLSLQFQSFNIDEKTGVTAESFMLNYGNGIFLNKYLYNINCHQFIDYFPYQIEKNNSSPKEANSKARRDQISNNKLISSAIGTISNNKNNNNNNLIINSSMGNNNRSLSKSKNFPINNKILFQ